MRLTTPVSVLVSIALASSAYAGGAAAKPAPSVAARLYRAAADSALADGQKRREDATEDRLVLLSAIEGLAREGDLDDLRAFVGGVDPKLGDSGFVLLAHAFLGDRKDVDAIVARLDKDKANAATHEPALECTIALAYNAIGDDKEADARLTVAHADCPTYVAEQSVHLGHLDRARAVLAAASAHPPTDVYGQAARAHELAAAQAKDARAEIAALADRLERDHPDDWIGMLADLAANANTAGWKDDARKLLAQAMAALAADDDVSRDAVIRSAASIDHASAVKLVRDTYGALAKDADWFTLLEGAVAFARAGDAADARAMLKRAIAADTGHHDQRSPWFADLHLGLDEVDLAIRAIPDVRDSRRASVILDVAEYTREHKTPASKAITAALATL